MRASRPERDADLGIAAVYQTQYRSLARIAALLLDDGAQAERIVQDAFVTLHRAWPQLRDSEAVLQHLRRAVVRGTRACRPRVPAAVPAAGRAEPAARRAEPAARRAEPAAGRAEPAAGRAEPAAGRAEPAEPAAGPAEPAAGPAADAATRPLVAVLGDLPSVQREALVLTFLADWPASQTAAAMGISRHALQANLQRGLAAVQASIARPP